MSLPFRSKDQRSSRRKTRSVYLEATQLEDRKLPAPIVDINTSTPVVKVVTTTTTTTTTTLSGTISLSSTPSTESAAGFTSVAELTSLNAFGGDMVQIAAGPGGDFGKGVYAISRGAGANADSLFRSYDLHAPINRPGVIYRVDPATGKASVFFDLNTVLSKIDSVSGTTPGNNAANPSTGLVNWYKIAFDTAGLFDGKPSMFVTSLDSQDPSKNAVYRIAPDGSFMGMFMQFPTNTSTGYPNIQPSSVYVPPPEQQSFLGGILVGNGAVSSGSTTVPVLFFDANQFVPGQKITNADPAKGIVETGMFLGPQVAITSANTFYGSPVYSAFTDFGVPVSPGSAAAPGVSGIQGYYGSLLIAGGKNIISASQLQEVSSGLIGASPTYYLTNPPVTITNADQASLIPTPFRRFQDMAFDYYNYFSYGATVTGGGTTGNPVTVTPNPPTYAGSLFVTDLSPGLTASITAGSTVMLTPVDGPGNFTVNYTTAAPNTINYASINTASIGGRVIRIASDGGVTPFASHFHVDPSLDNSSFINSTLSISFSADGTTLYVADMDGIWQFKTVTSLAGSSSGSVIGLNDLRSLGVPYEGQDLATAVVDTGVSANNPLFRGLVAPGRNVIMNGSATEDFAGQPQGHGTDAAGVVAQMVPQSTIVPVSVFTPNASFAAPVTGGTTANLIWNGMDWLSKHPTVKNPVYPNTYDRVMSATFGFGTAVTFGTEGNAYQAFPQTTVALAAKFAQLRHLGITSIAAAGQLDAGQYGGTPNAAGLLDPIRQSMSLPAVINSVVSVTGSYSFPFDTGPNATPVASNTGALQNGYGPVLVTNATRRAIAGAGITVFTAGDNLIFSDKIVGNANRSMTTDFVAPALDIPTFSRVLASTTTSVGGTGLAQFQQGGTSLSSAMVSGAFNLVSSAVGYWVTLAHNNGVTIDGYLNTPMGTHQLNFGAKQIGDLSSYLNPDGINAILQWTAAPITDSPTTLDNTSSAQLFPNANGPYPSISRLSVSNAVAAIEGTVALNYLINNGILDTIDTNHNGLITAQELQTFQDKATTIGMPEAGAMARLLGGTASITFNGFQYTAAGESPEQPDVLQRRFNFFDYAANGTLKGVISIPQLKMLAKTLLPAPDSFVIIDRQRASKNGYLLDPSTNRNYVALQYTSPKYAFIPASVIKRYKRFSPNKFGVGRGQPLSSQTPGFTLFGMAGKSNDGKVTNHDIPVNKVTTPATTAPKTVTAKATTAPKTGMSAATATFTTSTYQQQTVDSFTATIAKALAAGSTSSSTTAKPKA